MDPIAELLSQLSGVRRGLSGVSGASGLGSVLGLGALGSLGGALGSLGGIRFVTLFNTEVHRMTFLFF